MPLRHLSPKHPTRSALLVVCTGEILYICHGKNRASERELVHCGDCWMYYHLNSVRIEDTAELGHEKVLARPDHVNVNEQMLILESMFTPKRHVCAGGVTRSSSKHYKDDSRVLISSSESNNNKGYVPMYQLKPIHRSSMGSRNTQRHRATAGRRQCVCACTRHGNMRMDIPG
jgi:hypothetical protein